MCGILIKEKYLKETKKLVGNRGSTFQNTIHYKNLYLFSSVLSFQGVVRQPIERKDFIMMYNGEVYGCPVESDTLFIADLIEKFYAKGESCDCENCFCVLHSVFAEVNRYENEIALCIIKDDYIYFTKDYIGRRSLGYSLDPFIISSVQFDNELDPSLFYKYDIKNKKIFTDNKHDIFTHTVILNTFEQNVALLKNYLIESFRCRLNIFSTMIAFSNGVDSLLLAVIAHYAIPEDQEIILINTALNEDCWDRKFGEMNFKKLCKVFPQRKFILKKNNIQKINKEIIQKLMYPKTSAMDFNIATCHYYTAKCAKKYGKVLYTGAGADELFCGYAYHKKHMKFLEEDILQISERNLGRDDRIIANNNLETRFPFLDRKIIQLVKNISPDQLIDESCNKKILRRLLELEGFAEESIILKKSAQFGSGIFSVEKNNYLIN